jgi:hypothetical protein
MIEDLSDVALLRLNQIVGDKKRGIPPMLPLSRSTWLQGVKDGRFPRPVHIGKRCVAWKKSDITKLIEGFK